MLRRLSLNRHGNRGALSAAGREDGDHVNLVESESRGGEEGGVAGERDLMSDSEIDNVKVRRIDDGKRSYDVMISVTLSVSTC